MKKLSVLFFVLAMALLPHLSQAQVISFRATLAGWEENPPRSTPAMGWATATLDLSTNWFVFHDNWTGLTAGATASHIHAPAPLGANAPVIIPFGPANGFIAGTTSGSVNYSGMLTNLQVSEFLDGMAYVNVHTTTFPGGEIRGQLVPVPEPYT